MINQVATITQKLIYVIEDDAVNRLYMSKIIQNEGYKVIVFESAEAFLNYFNPKKEMPDLIFLDIGLPGLSGSALLKMMKERTEKDELAIVMLTAKQDVETVKASFAAGAVDYIMKPLKPELILERIKSNIYLKIDDYILKEMVQNLHFEDPVLMNNQGLVQIPKNEFRCYPLGYQGTQICFIIPSEIMPKALKSDTFEIYKSRIRVFRKKITRWQQIWPKI